MHTFNADVRLQKTEIAREINGTFGTIDILVIMLVSQYPVGIIESVKTSGPDNELMKSYFQLDAGCSSIRGKTEKGHVVSMSSLNAHGGVTTAV